MSGELSTESARHEPLEVTGDFGMSFVKCSCAIDYRPISRLWLLDHWQGEIEDGIAALNAVITRQREKHSQGGAR